MGRRCLAGIPVDPDTVCGPCLAGYAPAIEALAAIYDDLAVELVPYSQRADDQRGKAPPPASRPPVDVGVMGMRSAIAYRVGIWEEVLCHELGIRMPPRRGVRDQWIVHTAAPFLARRLPELAAIGRVSGPLWDPGIDIRVTGGAAVGWLARLSEEAAARLGVERHREVRLPGMCETCKMSLLTRRLGGGRVWCAGCGQTWPYAHYQAKVSMYLEL